MFVGSRVSLTPPAFEITKEPPPDAGAALCFRYYQSSVAKDRRRWLHWLFEAKKRFGLQVLNYAVTSNHVHLLVVETKPDVVAKSIQLIAGRTGEEFNQRKKRKGAFWEDRVDSHITSDG